MAEGRDNSTAALIAYQLQRAVSDPARAPTGTAAGPEAAGAAAGGAAVATTLAAASRTADLLEALAGNERPAPILARSVSDPRDPHWPVDAASWEPAQATRPGRHGKAPRLVFPPWTPQKGPPGHSGGHIKKLLKHYSVSCSIREDSALKAALAGGPPYVQLAAVTAAQAREALQDDRSIDALRPLFGWCLHTFSAEVASTSRSPQPAVGGSAAAAAGGGTNPGAMQGTGTKQTPYAFDESLVGHYPSPRDFTRHAGNLQRLQARLLREGEGGGGAGSILLDDNAGGASENSESLSAELLGTCYDTVLCRSETSVPYDDAHSSIVDYVARWRQTHRVGVSVTRAMKFVRDRPDPQAFTAADAVHLLTKKLTGLRIASHSVNMRYCWSRRVLHIWADTAVVANKLKRELQRSILWGITTGVLTEEAMGRIVEEEDPLNMFSLYKPNADSSSSSSSGASTPSLGWLETHQEFPAHSDFSSLAAVREGAACASGGGRQGASAGTPAGIVPPELLVDAFVMVTVCEPRSLMYGIIFENKQQWVPACMPDSQSAAAAAAAARRASKRDRDSSRRRARGRGRGRKKTVQGTATASSSTNKYHVRIPESYAQG